MLWTLLLKFSTVTEGYAAFYAGQFRGVPAGFVRVEGLDVKPLRWLGMASGSYYVLHMMTIPLGLSIASALHRKRGARRAGWWVCWCSLCGLWRSHCRLFAVTT